MCKVFLIDVMYAPLYRPSQRKKTQNSKSFIWALVPRLIVLCKIKLKINLMKKNKQFQIGIFPEKKRNRIFVILFTFRIEGFSIESFSMFRCCIYFRDSLTNRSDIIAPIDIVIFNSLLLLFFFWIDLQTNHVHNCRVLFFLFLTLKFCFLLYFVIWTSFWHILISYLSFFFCFSLLPRNYFESRKSAKLSSVLLCRTKSSSNRQQW